VVKTRPLDADRTGEDRERGEAHLGLGLRRVAGEIAARGLMPARFWWILGDGVSTAVCRKSWRSRGFGLRQGPRPGKGAGRGWRSSGRQCASAEHGCVGLLRNRKGDKYQ
jgi:hypothetical protein